MRSALTSVLNVFARLQLAWSLALDRHNPKSSVLDPVNQQNDDFEDSSDEVWVTRLHWILYLALLQQVDARCHVSVLVFILIVGRSTECCTIPRPPASRCVFKRHLSACCCVLGLLAAGCYCQRPQCDSQRFRHDALRRARPDALHSPDAARSESIRYTPLRPPIGFDFPAVHSSLMTTETDGCDGNHVSVCIAVIAGWACWLAAELQQWGCVDIGPAGRQRHPELSRPTSGRCAASCIPACSDCCSMQTSYLLVLSSGRRVPKPFRTSVQFGQAMPWINLTLFFSCNPAAGAWRPDPGPHAMD